METKLKALVRYLSEIDVEREYIDDLILESFDDDNNDRYLVGDYAYTILSFREVEDALYDKAEEYADDFVYEVNLLLENQSFYKDNFGATSIIDRDQLVDNILSTLSYEKEFKVELVWDEIYNIYRD